MTDGDCTCRGEPSVMDRIIESLCWTPESGKTLSIDYISIFKKGEKKRGRDVPCEHQWEESLSRCSFQPKADFRTRKITRDKEGHCVMMKRAVLQGDITILKVYVPNNPSKYVRQRQQSSEGERNARLQRETSTCLVQ